MIITRILAVAFAALAVSATPSPTTTMKRQLAFNPVDVVPAPLSGFLAPHGPPPARGLTNAQRMSRGLSPNRPNFAARRAPHARRSSSPCTTTTGAIAITIQQLGGGIQNKFLGPPNAFGGFTASDDVGSALSVSFCYSSPSATVGITTVSGGFSNFPYLAFVEGFAGDGPDLATGSSNYAYLAASTETPAGSTAVLQANSFSAASGAPEGVETDVFTVDLGTGSITPSWVNTNGDNVAVSFVYMPSSNAFVITGDFDAFSNAFGEPESATMSFVPQP